DLCPPGSTVFPFTTLFRSANIDLSLAEMELVGMVARERRLGGVLAPLRDEYDFVLVDCQPSLGLLTINALAAVDEVLVPVACERSEEHTSELQSRENLVCR